MFYASLNLTNTSVVTDLLQRQVGSMVLNNFHIATSKQRDLQEVSKAIFRISICHHSANRRLDPSLKCNLAKVDCGLL